MAARGQERGHRSSSGLFLSRNHTGYRDYTLSPPAQAGIRIHLSPGLWISCP
ncbi:rCG46001 [Rattus norvegicus]|uniref:RCG46001 n=1 Tax=Rattus norvegicus TaxID=10116 RepID=A6IBV7_RAT|nr:rCG46001 [Rattus norvegicus]